MLVSGLKNILMLTTMHNIVNVSIDERKKPHVMVFYDSTKGGVDVVDQLIYPVNISIFSNTFNAI